MVDDRRDSLKAPTVRGFHRAVIAMGCAVLSFGAFLIWQLVPSAVQPGDGHSRPTPAGPPHTETKNVTDSPISESEADAGDSFAAARHRMVETQIRARGITDARVLAAMERVARHRFVPEHLQASAYADHPLPIGHGQTISQPYIVALMTEQVHPEANDKALDVGTGSGYQAAVLAQLCKKVLSIEIVKDLADQARTRLASLGYANVTVRSGDGYRGWPEEAPFDVIVVAAAPDRVPPPLLDQLAPGGRLVIPVGRYTQELVVVEKKPDGQLRQRRVTAVAFVPMTGEAQK